MYFAAHLRSLVQRTIIDCHRPPMWIFRDSNAHGFADKRQTNGDQRQCRRQTHTAQCVGVQQMVVNLNSDLS